MIKVLIHIREQSQPIEREAINTYTKGPLYCVYLGNGKVEKYPISEIFRVTEDYGTR
jgi:hypothetical protein